MTHSFILHHYNISPYSEKIRLMFGLTNSRWYSLTSPAQPPRPNIDPLTGGYRRIPVAQLGADIFCDTSIITEEIENATGCNALNQSLLSEQARALVVQAEKEAFFAALSSVPPKQLMITLLKEFGPFRIGRFLKDRKQLLKTASIRLPLGKKATHIFTDLLEAVENQLSNQKWINGNEPTLADFAVFHPIWIFVRCNRKPLVAGPKVLTWYQQVKDIGHGTAEKISRKQAFSIARESTPRALPASVEQPPFEPGTQVTVAPGDYGQTPVTGTLAAITESRIILARETTGFGTLHVHFPREGYELSN